MFHKAASPKPAMSGFGMASAPKRAKRRAIGWGFARGLAAAVLSMALKGCENNDTCYPDGTASATGEYSCVSDTFCGNQGSANRLGAMSLAACMTQCVARDCRVIQYDCGSECWLLDSCGEHKESSCSSSALVEHEATYWFHA